MSTGQNVLADPQFSMAKVLRPFENFEDAYAGQAATIPVAFFPPGEDGNPAPLDQQVGSDGISPNLLRYTPVPLGSRILVYIPHCITWQNSIPNPIIETSYVYTFHWRVRNLGSSASSMRSHEGAKPYHSRTYPGRPDNTDAASVLRDAIPSATRTVVIEQPESAGNLQQVQHLRRERIRLMNTYTDSSALPLIPGGGSGEHMQGILDPNQFAVALQDIARSSLFVPFEFTCEGDELLIEANRYDAWDGGAAWTFTGLNAPDASFSNVYGRNAIGPEQPLRPGLGIYLFTGA